MLYIIHIYQTQLELVLKLVFLLALKLLCWDDFVGIEWHH